MIGPLLLFDKSFPQMLNAEEVFELSVLFKPVGTAVDLGNSIYERSATTPPGFPIQHTQPARDGGSGDSQRPRMVKIFKCAERSRSSMMDVEDEHNHMRAAFGLRYRFGKPATPARE